MSAISFLNFKAKNAAARQLVTKATTEGLQVQGMQNKQRFTQQFVSEALILSDLFNMDELAAVELLMAGGESLSITRICLALCHVFSFSMFSFIFFFSFWLCLSVPVCLSMSNF